MTEAVAGPVRERVHPRRPGPAHKLTKSPWPWRDRSGRFSWIKTAALLAELAPAAWLAWQAAAGQLGARPLTEANHQAGLAAIRLLLATVLVSPVRAIFNWPRLVLVRRQLGLAALFYALAHVLLYAWDENWNAVRVSMEILHRFYLEVGFVALVGLGVLGVTSTDRSLRRLGHGWKRLHRVIHLLMVLAVFHYFLQSKADVAAATLLAGLFAWAIGWRMLPPGSDRAPLPLAGLAVGSAAAAAALEYAWYGLATRIDPLRPLRAELDLTYGPHPAGQVLLLCGGMTVAATLAWARHRERLHRSVWWGPALYAGAALAAAAVIYAFGLADDWLPDAWPFWPAATAFVAAAAALGLLRQSLVHGRKTLDVVCGAILLLALLARLAV